MSISFLAQIKHLENKVMAFQRYSQSKIHRHAKKNAKYTFLHKIVAYVTKNKKNLLG